MRVRYVSYLAIIAAAILSSSISAGAAPNGDTDGDGKLSLAEFQTVTQKRLMRADTDASGTISLQEWLARPAAAKATKDPTKRFNRLDGNQDGQLDTAEIDQLAKRRFAALDKNADGAVTGEERLARKGVQTKTDTTNDDSAGTPKARP
jgi:hypothetical protein